MTDGNIFASLHTRCHFLLSLFAFLANGNTIERRRGSAENYHFTRIDIKSFLFAGRRSLHNLGKKSREGSPTVVRKSPDILHRGRTNNLAFATSDQCPEILLIEGSQRVEISILAPTSSGLFSLSTRLHATRVAKLITSYIPIPRINFFVLDLDWLSPIYSSAIPPNERLYHYRVWIVLNTLAINLREPRIRSSNIAPLVSPLLWLISRWITVVTACVRKQREEVLVILAVFHYDQLQVYRVYTLSVEKF